MCYLQLLMGICLNHEYALKIYLHGVFEVLEGIHSSILTVLDLRDLKTEASFCLDLTILRSLAYVWQLSWALSLHAGSFIYWSGHCQISSFGFCCHS